jgi:hypothetical protein
MSQYPREDLRFCDTEEATGEVSAILDPQGCLIGTPNCHGLSSTLLRGSSPQLLNSGISSPSQSRVVRLDQAR